MRHGNSRRSRGRGGSSRKPGAQRSQVFDSNGPDVRIRGTAHQVTEKYLALAKDAESSGDKILAESYFQFAEHYQRIINSWNDDQDSGSGSGSNQEQNKDQGQSHDQKPRGRSNASKGNQAAQDDLGLPASMLTPSNLSNESTQDKKETADGDA